MTNPLYTAADAPHPDLIGRDVCSVALVPECFLTEHDGDAEAAGRAFDARLVEDLEPGQGFFVDSELSYQRVAVVLRHLSTGSTATASDDHLTGHRRKAPRRSSGGTASAPAATKKQNGRRAGARTSDATPAPTTAAS